MTLCQNLKSPELAEDLCASISAEKTDYTFEEMSEFFQKIQSTDGLRMEVPLGQALQYDYPMPADPNSRTIDGPRVEKATHGQNEEWRGATGLRVHSQQSNKRVLCGRCHWQHSPVQVMPR